ncbi:multidrug transporter MatE [Pontibacillus halophilus JSM 076056 = DSM 19796]|uniref:Probable multidrug resistance protein NorM n=1 Tax=Pontibacillus halophilus JSM 076056 = DSM 19796 TaxID=1385510 RepID=A0A0A5GHW6_9BACI|nr:MATE family efflux transporter [Pontibacillus halophilus]KGX90710.1 multidrug transporter MatE [Pontibacillus halophilus JSM 076056 = DSM 19796]
MYKTHTLKQKIKLFLLLLYPILITQLGMYSMNFFDTIMTGQVSKEDLAGVAIGSSLWVPIFTGINGIMLAIAPIVAQLTGAKQNNHVSYVVRQGVYLSFILAVLLCIVGFFLVDPILSLMDLEEKVRRVAKYYLLALGTGIIPLFIYNLLHSFVDALGHTRVTMLITLITLPFNLAFNYVFIFGKFGFPAMGGIGAGIASSLTYWIAALIAILIIAKFRPFASFSILKGWEKPNWPTWKEQLKIGIPIGFAIFFETSIFAAVTLFMSTYDTTTIAAHQAAMNFASFIYMIPLSISMTLTIAVGFEVGAKRFKDAKVYSYLGIGLAVIMAAIGGLIIYTFDYKVASLYSNTPAVIEQTTYFLFYAIFFQLSDAFGAPIQGALRGYKDVNITFFMALVSYWVIGLPSGYLFANYTELGPYGYWMGLIIGLAAGAVALMYRLNQKRTENEPIQQSL